MKKLAILLFTTFNFFAYSQQNCDADIYSGSYMNYMQHQINWAPLPQNNQTVKTLLVNYILFADDNGTFGWKDTQGARDSIEYCVNVWANNIYQYVQPRGYNITLPPNYNDVMLTDSKIRLELNKIIYINDSDVFYSSGNYIDNKHKIALQQYDSINGTNSFDALNVYHMLDTTALVNGWGVWFETLQEIQIFKPLPTTSFTAGTYSDAILLAHEIGHALGLRHTTYFDPIWGQENKSPSNTDFLTDVFGLETPIQMTDGTCGSYPDNSVTPDVYFPNFCLWDDPTFTYGYTPFMSQRGEARFISPMQAGRMHRNLSLFMPTTANDPQVKNWIKEKTPAPNNYIVDNNELQIWDFKIKMYQNIEVMPGATLIIKCELLMPIEGKILVHPGGTLVVDGGTIDCAHDGFWGGIEVIGQTNYPALPNYQGVAILRNNGIIKNAYKGISNWQTNQWNKRGGIINVNDFTFLNNLKSIEIIKEFTTTAGFNNQADLNINNTSFIWDDDYRGKKTIAHISMWEKNSATFTNCSFIDSRTTPSAYLLNQHDRRNYGIYTLDAEYEANSCHFSGLDFGVYASNSSTENFINVNNSTFTNNLFSVTTVNVNNPNIINNVFVVNFPLNQTIYQQLANATNVTPWSVQVINSNGIEISDNEFFQNIPINTFGVVCSNLGPHDNLVKNNIFHNVTIPVAAQGVNRGSNTGIGGALQGLEFKCNEYYNAFRDQYVVPTLNNTTPIYYYATGVKDISGGNVTAVGNYHTTNPSPRGNYYNTTPNSVTYTYHNSPLETPNSVSSNIIPISTNSVSPCFPGNPPGFLIDKGSLMVAVDSAETKFNQAKNNLSALVNGGNTNQLIQQIENLSPQNKHQLRQNLVSYSPYLTEDIIRLALNNPPNKYPHLWALELVLLNIDVAKNNPDFMDFLTNKDNSMPYGMRLMIKAYAHYSPYTDYKFKQTELASLGTERSYAYNYLIEAYLSSHEDSTFIDSAAYWIQQKGDLMYQTRLIDISLQKGDYAIANEQIVTFSNQINNLPQMYQQEMLDYVGFKMNLISFKTKTGGLANLSETDIDYLRQTVKTKTGTVKSEAQEILCFFYGECGDYDVVIDFNSANKLAGTTDEDIEDDKTPDVEVKLYPNPANDWLAIELPLSNNVYNINIYSLSGQLVHQQQINIPLFILETINYKEGMYVINITDVEGSIIATKKFMITH